MKAHIVSTGAAVPDKIMTNDDLSQLVDTSDEWIFSHTGIRTRRIASDQESTSDLAVAASRQALDRAGLAAEDVDLILVATSTPDYPSFPATASLVQEKLGCPRAGAMDVSAACTGFVYGLETARCFIESGGARNVLVIGAEIFSRIVDWTDRNTCVLFGDGAGAVLVQAGPDEGQGIMGAILGSDGSGGDALERKLGGVKYPWMPGQEKPVEGGSPFVTMDGRRVYNFAVRVIKDSILEILEKHGLGLEDLKAIVPHQANVRIIDAAAKRLGVSPELFYMNIEKYANTSAASIPLALNEMAEKNLLQKGDLVLTVGFGAGLTYGANLLRWK